MLRALTAGLDSIRRAPMVQAVAIGTIAVSMMLVGVVRMSALNIGRIASTWGRGVQVTVYLEEGVSPGRARRISRAVARLPGVTSARLVSSHQAYERLRRGLGDRASLLDGVEETLLPESIELTLEDGMAGVVRLAPDLDRLRRTVGVEEVEMMGDWVDRLVAAERLLHIGGPILGLLIGVACIYIISSTIRLGVFARREEIEILKLVGATDRFVRAPFLVEGALQGAVGAGVAVTFLYLLYRAAAPGLEHALGTALSAVELTFLPGVEVALAVLAGGLLGLTGSSLAVERHVSETL